MSGLSCHFGNVELPELLEATQWPKPSKQKAALFREHRDVKQSTEHGSLCILFISGTMIQATCHVNVHESSEKTQ